MPHTYSNEFGERWRLEIDDDGIIRLGGDETDDEMLAVGFPTVSGGLILSWQEMAWLATIMTQIQSRMALSAKNNLAEVSDKVQAEEEGDE